MGLAERRKAAEIEAAVFPKFKTELQTITGVDAQIEVNWNEMDFESIMDGVARNMTECVLAAMKEVCKDDMGKSAVKGAFKKIVVKQHPSASASAVFKSGVLTLTSNWGSSYPTSRDIQTELEKNL